MGTKKRAVRGRGGERGGERASGILVRSTESN